MRAAKKSESAAAAAKNILRFGLPLRSENEIHKICATENPATPKRKFFEPIGARVKIRKKSPAVVAASPNHANNAHRTVPPLRRGYEANRSAGVNGAIKSALPAIKATVNTRAGKNQIIEMKMPHLKKISSIYPTISPHADR